MYLKKLDMIGFKSFAESTTVTFQPGITAIVGPNGCGKSNIVDAILWVLGEQSTKTLRSDKMEDVIFNGTEARRPLNLAEVVLTIGDVSGEMDSPFGKFQEIGISRRLFRSGESDYLINKIPSRLKDVRDLLIDAGAGHKGHTIIEQGKVDQLLNPSANDRRELIEETAGIAKYKIRKAEAERKLDATQQNLLRVTDIISEVHRQMNALDRQVKKTRTFKTLQDETRTLEIRILIIDYRSHQASLMELIGDLNDLRTNVSARMAELARTQTQLHDIKTSLIEKESTLSSLKQSCYDNQILIQRQENRIELLRGQIQSWNEQTHRLAEEQVQIGESILQAEGAEGETTSRLEAEAGKLAGRETVLSEIEARLAGAEAESARHQESLDSIKAHLLDAMSSLSQLKNESAGLESRQKEIGRIQEKGRLELTSTIEKRELAQTALSIERIHGGAFLEEVARLSGEQDRLSEELQQKQALSETQSDRNLRLREELTLLQARLASLRENEKAITLSQAGIRTILKEQPDVQSRLHGLVADLLDVPPEYEASIEAVLGNQLQGMLTEDHGTTRDIVHRLKAERSGRGVFIPRVPRTLHFSSRFPRTDTPGVIGPLLNQIRVRPGFEAVAESLLGGILLVREMDTALSLWQAEEIDYSIVTLEGEFLEPTGILQGGTAGETDQGLLQTRRKIHETEEKESSITNRLESEETSRRELNDVIEQLKQQQAALSEKRQQVDEASVAQQKKVAVSEQEISGLEERIGFLTEEDIQEKAESEAVEQKRGENTHSLNEGQSSVTALETQLRSTEDEHRAVLEKREIFRAELTQLKVEVTALRERQDGLHREKTRLQEEQVSLKSLRKTKTEETSSLEARGLAAQQDIENTETEVHSLAARLTEMQKELSAQTEGYTNNLDQVKRLENQEAESRSEVGRIEKLISEQDIRQAELKITVEHLVQQAAENHKADLPALASESPEIEMTTEERNQNNTRLAELKRKLEQMGAINLAAIEEQQELEERFRFLTEQETDLRQSIEDLNTAIVKINKTTKAMFLSAYTALREKFQEVFKEFFEGGEADLVLMDEQNPLDCGIEIVAQPPGKRVKGITLLSGGEKALTAISLLFASFLIHHSPFCILDEIDAPLDEENIRRFLRVLRRMTAHSQFLIITHNKRTMEEADLLYGVTMEEPGVTKLVSVKMEGAHENGHATTGPKSIRPESTPAGTS